VIVRCLENDPRQRPASALAVAAALPGGDPLAAALAAGEIPSPEMVAAAGTEGGLRPGIAVACLAVVVLGIVATALMRPTWGLLEYVPATKSPQALADRSREMLTRLGYPEAPVDKAYGFSWDYEYLRQIQDEETSPDRWDKLALGQPAVLLFWYRESPRLLAPDNTRGRVRSSDPPLTVSGMTRVILDGGGRLTALRAVPPQVDESEEAAPEPDWAMLFAEAGLDPADFSPVPSTWVPPEYSDTRAAWEGVYPDNPDVAIRIEAAAYRGKPVYFSVVDPWTRPARMEPFQMTAAEKAVAFIFLTVLVLLGIGALVLTRINLRGGRGDRKGAHRVGLYMVVVSLLSWAFQASHVPDFDEVSLVINAIAMALFVGGLAWLGYLALEPFVRRWWPDTIVSWNRLLAGRFRDPLVGRDILIGGAFAVVLNLNAELRWMLPRWLGLPSPMPAGVRFDALLGGRYLASQIIGELTAVIVPIGLLFLLLLLRIVLRRQWLAIAGIVLFVAGVHLMQVDNLVLELLFIGVWLVLVLTVLVRFGLLATCFMFVISNLTYSYPITIDFNAWYAGRGVSALLVGLALVAYGFTTSLAGRSLVPRDIAGGGHSWAGHES
jgi:serine/threonine-protein kinase